MQWAKNLCRFCGQIEAVCYDIFDADLGYVDKIKKYLKLEISREDFKPKLICQFCVRKLYELSEFVDTCHVTNQKFESIYYNYECIQNQQQTVIVSNKQGPEKNLEFCKTAAVFDNVNLAYPLIDSNILDFRSSFSHPSNQGNSESYFDYECQNSVNTPMKVSNNLNCLNTFIEPFDSIKKSEIISVDAVRLSLLQSTECSLPKEPLSKPKKRLPCPHCDKTFLRRANLNAHIAIHTKIKPFVCVECSKTFAIKTHLTSHQKTHSDIYRCKFCGKRFSVPSKLKRHLRVHTNDRPFMCDIEGCSKSFSDKRNLICHKETQHSEKCSFQCERCEKCFKTKYRLSRHCKTHLDGSVYVCDLCGKCYKHRTNLVVHLKNHSECIKCDKYCPSKIKLAEHLPSCK